VTKVFIAPDIKTAPFGIKRLIEAMHKHLPGLGIEIVNSEAEADVVNAHAMAFVDTKKPVIYSSHGLYWADHHWDNGYLYANQQMIEYMTRAQAITAVSNWVGHALSRGILHKPQVIYHGVDADEWQPTSQHQGYVLWNKGRADVVSNPDEMNKLAELMPDVGFVSTFGRPATNVQIVGEVPYSQMHDMVAKAAVYLSTARETMGIGTLEALASGVPVAGWHHGGTAEIITNGHNGWLAPYGDYEQLAECVRHCLANREKLSANARKTAVEKWSWDVPMAQYALIFQTVHQNYSRKRPTVSVIVTAHNLGNYLPDCLNSVQGQTLSDWECLIVDDASTDNTAEICEEFCGLDGRFTYLPTPKNLKLSGARNFGFEQANGRYVLYLDADDYLAENALGLLAGFLDDNPEFSVAYGHLDLIDEDGSNRRRNDWPFDDFDWFQQMAHLNQLPYSAMMRREVLERSGGYRTRNWRAEDASLWCRLTSLGFRATKATDKPTLVYRLRSNSKGATERQKFRDGDGDWTSWFPWRLGARNAQEGLSLIRQGKQPRTATVPFGAQGTPPNWCWPVWSHHDPIVSVIIPVGPRHAHLLVDALDSVQAQTFPFWEAVVVNDTGKPLDTSPWPWARVVESGEHNIATSRNRGIEAARAPLVLFLDVDDLLLPTAVENMLRTFVEADGSRYIYCDWYAIELDGSHKKHGSKEYDRSSTDGSKHPITVLMPTEWALNLTFDEAVPGWEDWEFFIKAAVTGHCGQRLPEALLVYRMQTGQRREQSLADKDLTLPILKERYAGYFTGEKPMAGCCGGDDTTVLEAKRALGLLPQLQMSGAIQRSSNGMSDTVRIEYLGENQGAITLKSAGGVPLKQPIKAGNNLFHRFHDVDPDDGTRLVETGRFRFVSEPAIDLSQAAVVPEPPDAETETAELETVEGDAEGEETAELDNPEGMTVAEAKAYALELSSANLEQFLETEKTGKSRNSLVSALETMLADAQRIEQVEAG